MITESSQYYTMDPIPQASYNHRLTMKEEDYLEAIFNVSLVKGYAKSRDVAEELNVGPSSVGEMFAKLDKKGLVVYRKYEGVTLTEPGKIIAGQVKFRHDILVDFLEIVGVPEPFASKDACFMEHELSTVTIQKIREFVAAKKQK